MAVIGGHNGSGLLAVELNIDAATLNVVRERAPRCVRREIHKHHRTRRRRGRRHGLVREEVQEVGLGVDHPLPRCIQLLLDPFDVERGGLEQRRVGKFPPSASERDRVVVLDEARRFVSQQPSQRSRERKRDRKRLVGVLCWLDVWRVCLRDSGTAT